MTNDLMVAERGSKLGLPEVLFNMFPGMGAYSLLCRRLDGARAQQLILSGRLYEAEELSEMGLIDLVVPAGRGRGGGARATSSATAHSMACCSALSQVARRCQPVSYDELIDVTEIWVETALALDRGRSAADGAPGGGAGAAPGPGGGADRAGAVSVAG